MDQRLKQYKKKHNLTDSQLYDYVNYLNKNTDVKINYCVICDEYTNDYYHSLKTKHALKMSLILKQ